MDEHNRFRRDDPAREGPNRSFRSFYQGSQARNGSTTSSTGPSLGPDGKSPQDAYLGGIGLAYQVIDQYISAGRNAAEQFNRQFYNLTAGGDELQMLIERLLRFQSEIMPIWLDMVTNLVRVDPQSMAGAPDRYPGMKAPDRSYAGPGSAAGGPAPAPAQPATAQFTLEISSQRAVEVSVRLDPGAERTALGCAGLLAANHPETPIAGIGFTSHPDGPIKIRISIADDQPPGIYSGVVVERRSGEPRGTLTIRVSGPAAKTSRRK